MAYGQLTLSIPGVSPPIPALTLSRFPTDGGYLRSLIGFATAAGRSNWGTPAITGPAYAPVYSWAVGVLLTEQETLQLEALALWQDAQYKAGLDGALSFTDEIEYLPAEPNPHSRALVAPLTPSWSADYRYGYGIFEVKLELPPESRTAVGKWATGEPAKLCTFTLLEL